MNNYTLLKYLNQILQPEKFEDYGPNGLQIEGNPEIEKIVTGVSLSDQLIEHAITANADAIIVHHGIFWYKDSYTLSGIKRRRIKKLLEHDINLYAYHLPLDSHLDLGNNAQLAKQLNISVSGQSSKYGLLWYGEISESMALSELLKVISSKIGREPLCLANDLGVLVKKIAWCTGAAPSMFTDAIALGVDVYITGEASESTMGIAKESNVVFIEAGHYATERYGILALTNYIEQILLIDSEFIELYNPV